MLSDTAEYALRAILYIAQQETADDLVRADDVSKALNVPRNYLSKILHTLAREGVLSSMRGPRGGFRLRRDPDRLALIKVISPFDPMEPRRVCLLGRPTCSDGNPCPAHERWKGISEQVGKFFSDTTIGDLLRNPGELAVKPVSRAKPVRN